MKYFLIIAFLIPLSAFGQSLAGVNGDCQIGGQQTLTSGLPSTGTQQIGTSNVNQGAGVQASFPSCRVTVYATGTTNKAAIYSNNNPSPSSLSNPFTANTDGSYTFFISQGACYDILISSGSVTMPYSRTLADVCVGTGGGGGGGSGLGPFTVNRLIKAATTTSLSSATCSDDGVFPTACSTGLNLVGSALLESKTNNSSTGTTANLLIARDSSSNAINAQPTDQNNIIGVAAFNAGTTGSVTYAVAGNFPLMFDNQTGIGDYVTLGATSRGHDSGAVQPSVRNYGRITSVNAGPGTLANVDLDMSSNGSTTSGGSGIVSNCSGVGGVFYAQSTGTTASCDILFTTDGAGNVGVTTLTTHGPGNGTVQVFDSNGAADNSLLIASNGGDSTIKWLDPMGNTLGDIAFRAAFGNVRIDSQAATSARQVSLVVESDPTEIAASCPLGTNQGCIEVDSQATAFSFGTGDVASHQGGAQWRGNSLGATWMGVPNVAGGAGGANYILLPTVSGIVMLDTNAGVVSAANYSGSTWTDSVVTGYGTSSCSSPGCNIQVPDVIAGDGHLTTPSIPSNVNLTFPGEAVFTSGTINVGRFTKLFGQGAQLQLSGSGAIGINQTTQALFQTNDKFLVDGIRINGNSQANSTGLFVGGGTAQHANYNTSIENATVGMQYDGAQFAESYNANLFQNTNGLIIHSLAGGGGNSNTFYGLKTGSNTVGTLIYADTGIGQGQNYFINHSCLANSVNCMAAFGNTFQTDVHWYGGAPENNATGASTATVNGKVVKKSTVYGNLAAIYWTDVNVAEASANPVMLLESNSQATIINPTGYGSQFGKYVSTDSTSYVALNGTLAGNGIYQNVTTYPGNITAGRGAAVGSPVSYLNGSVPNAYTGNVLVPPFSATTGTSSNAIVSDALYGNVNSVTYAASAGSTSTNLFTIANAIPSQGVASDYRISILLQASVNTSLECYGHFSGGDMGIKFTNVPLYAGVWSRVLSWTYNVAASHPVDFSCFPDDSAGATVKVTRLESIARPAGSGTGSDAGILTAYDGAQIIQSGAVNPNGFNTLSGTRIQSTGALAPTCAFTSGGGTSPSCALDTGSSDSAGIIKATTGSGSPAGSGTITLTFSTTGGPFGTNKPICLYMASDGGTAAWTSNPYFKDLTNTTTSDLFIWGNGTVPTALSTASTYWINYQCWAK